MSEATANVGRDEVWIEKYRPRTLDEVGGQEAITSRLSSYVEREDLPHLLFSGPAGVGKCVTGDTPILTNGGVERIEDVVGTVDGFAEPAGDLRVLTFDGSEFRYVEPSTLFSKRADELHEIHTRDGSTLAVTPEHKLLVIGRDGLEWKPADEISVGERIVRPRSIPLPEGRTELDWLSAMDGDRTLVHVTEEFAQEHHIPPEENEIGEQKAVLAGIRQGRDDEEIAAAGDLARSTVRDHRREFSRVDSDNPSTVCSLGFLRELDVSREQLKQHVTGIQYVTPANNRSDRITPPWSVTPELATFVGLAISGASIGRSSIIFYNDDDRLLDRFSELARATFDINPAEGVQQGVPYRAIHTRTVTHYLESCFDLFDGSTAGGNFGSTLITADAESRSAFLRAVFDAEGHVTTQGRIELTQKNGDYITALSYLLSGFGIPTRRATDLKAATNGSGEKREDHVLYVSGAPALTRFQEEIGFGISEKAKRLAQVAEREPNPNHDTVPAQSAVDDLCEALFLPKQELVSDSLNPSNPGRENYRRVVDQVLAAANDRLETAQRVLADLACQERAVDALSAVPAARASDRRALVPIEIRRRVGRATGIRSDRLLEYSNGRRSPGARRARGLLAEDGLIGVRPEISQVQEDLMRAITSLDIPFSRIAKGTPLRETEVINLLTNDDHDVATLARFSTVAERIRTEAEKMLDESVFQAIVTLETIASADLYYDEVQAIDRDTGRERVYDLTVPETHNYVGGAVPTVLHNTTAAIAIAREIYGDDWESNFLELNASDERGIDVVRDRIKNFARASFGGFDYRIIFLDEADALTSDAQSALRRTMEQFSNNTRFILSCNYSSRIIDPIQSRCAVFRFSGIPDEAVAARIREIAEEEDIELADDGVDALVYAADGDMRKAINALQAAAVLGDTVDEAAVFTITSTAKPEDIRKMVEAALAGDFSGARAVLDDLLTEQGLAGGAVIDQLHRAVWDVDLDDRAAVRLLDRIGEADYRIAEGANERVQLEALLAAVALQAEK